MGNRLSKITTRTGDDGTTGLGDGSRTGKDSLRVAAIGDVDELNSALGVLLADQLDDDLRTELGAIQHDLFDLGGELCIPGFENIKLEQITNLDMLIERHNATLKPLAEFIVPGGSRPAALAHIVRTVCRRAERSVVALGRQEQVRPACGQYLNRLSDLMFVIARVLNQRASHGDVLWRHERSRSRP